MGETDSYLCLALSPDETRLALGDGTGTIRLWDFNTMPPQQLATLPVNDGLLSEIGFSPDGATLVSKSYQGVRFWHAPSLAEIQEPASK
jgi:WD40 repeat protein